MRFVYATDLHGNQDAIEQTFDFARVEQADAVVFGGDLTPKSVAIKLAPRTDLLDENADDDREKETPPDGEILPAEMLKCDAECPSFTQSLGDIRRLNEKFGTAVLAKHLERQGAIIVRQTNQYYEFESMLAEQVLLDKLRVFFSEAQLPGIRARLQLSDEEMEMVRDCVAEWFKEFERVWDAQRKADFLRKCRSTFGGRQDDFDQLALSKHIEECVLWEVAGAEPSEIFREVEKLLRGKKGRFAKHLSGKFRDLENRFLRASAYRGLIEEAHIAALAEYSTVAQLKRDAENPASIRQGQEKFFREFFLPQVRKWRKAQGDKLVYAMFGNDDMIENVALLDEAEGEGLLRHLHNKVHDFGDDFAIAGYGFVENLPARTEYRRWQKEGADILSDFWKLRTRAGQRKTIWVIHQPPLGCLDRAESGNAGSQTVRQFLLESQPCFALFGHIHEAPRLTGNCAAQLGRTLCVNPGGEHREGLQAALIDTKTLEVKRRNTP